MDPYPFPTLLVLAVGWAMFGLFVVLLLRSRRSVPATGVDDSVLLPAPPPELSPAMAAALRTGKFDIEAFTVALADLACRGRITLRGHIEPGWPGLDIEVGPRQHGDGAGVRRPARPMGKAETELLENIRPYATDQVVRYGDVRNGTGWCWYLEFRSTLRKGAESSQLFVSNSVKAFSFWSQYGAWTGVAGISLFGLLKSRSNMGDTFPAGLYQASFWAGLLGVLILLLSLTLYYVRTGKGAALLAQTYAYRNTLRYELGRAATLEEATVGAQGKMPWLEPGEVIVWALALGLRNEALKVVIPAQSADQDPSGMTPYSKDNPFVLSVAVLPEMAASIISRRPNSRISRRQAREREERESQLRQ